MKTFITAAFFILMTLGAPAQNLESMLDDLDRALDRRDTYFMAHEHRIDSAKAKLAHIHASDLKAIADAYNHIFDLYKSYQGDSAAVYAMREAEVAQATGDPELIVRAQMDRLYSKITGGLFSEAVDIVRTTDLSNVSDTAKGNFYFYCNRLYTDMSNYADGTFSDENSRKSKAYSDSVLAYLPPDSYRAQYSQIFKTLDNKTTDEKIDIFTRLCERPDVSVDEKAMVASILADQYCAKGDDNMCAFYKAQSAIYDLQAAKRETTSKKDLARMIFELGDLDRANRYIQLAFEDANFFNSRHRKGEIGQLANLIEHARYLTVNEERSTFLWLAVALIVLLVLLVIMVVVIMRRNRQVRESRKLLEIRNAEVEKANDSLAAINDKLQKAYDHIAESNRIKDEYIGFGFSANAEYVSKLEALYKLVKRKLKVRQYDDLESVLKDSDIRREKEAMKANFDRVFLRLFPTFIDDFNALFPPDEQPADTPAAPGVLTPEMRIFALIRLGINDCSDIARFLNYSVNTVNTYKTKTKNRSNVPNEQFEARIMEIRSIG